MIYTDVEHTEKNKFHQKKKYWKDRGSQISVVSIRMWVAEWTAVIDKIYGYEINRREISEFAHMII